MNRRKGVLVALSVVGIAIVALGVLLVLARMNGWGWAGDGLGQVFSRGTGYRYFDRSRYFGHMGFRFPWLTVAGFAILIALVAGFGRRHRHFGGHGPEGRDSPMDRPWERESAMEILRREFAEGRIDKDEFLARKHVLEESEK